MKVRQFTKDERGLLLYLETRAVDHSGYVASAHMNGNDIDIAKRWNEEGFVRFGRILFREHRHPRNRLKVCPYWCELSEEAWAAAHAERRARGIRSMHDPEIRTERKDG